MNLNSCARVIIRKQTTPEEDPNTTNFGFTKNFPTDPTSADTFTLQDDGVKDYGQTVRQGSNYVVDENVIPNGWDLQSINCDASDNVSPIIDVGGGTVTFDIDSSADVVDCTYRNRVRGRIEIEKQTDPAGGTGFGFTSNLPAPTTSSRSTTTGSRTPTTCSRAPIRSPRTT